jgi:hypothetical protein
LSAPHTAHVIGINKTRTTREKKKQLQNEAMDKEKNIPYHKHS